MKLERFIIPLEISARILDPELLSYKIKGAIAKYQGVLYFAIASFL